jgi:ABC-type branched-subunit amino acid transport system ATPase component
VFEIVSGFVRPDRGSVSLDGVDITGRAPESIARAGLVRSFQGGRVFPTMTVRQAIRTATEQGSGGEPAEPIAELLGLTPHMDDRIGSLSTGIVRLVEVACLASTGARVLLLDEPSAGIAHTETEQLARALEQLRSDLGLTLVIIDHDLGLLARLSDRLVALEAGGVVAVGPPDAVRTDPTVIVGYLGSSASAR